MKKVFNSFFVIVAAMITLAGCTKQETDAPETKNVQFFAQSIETKTVFGALADDGKTYPTLWNSGDKLKVLLNIEQVSGTEKTAEVECDDLAESAYFEVAFSPSVKPETYTYYAVSPSTAFNGKSSNDGRITVVIPTEQTPLETSVDKSAQIIYAVAPADAEQTSVDMHFHHLTAYGKFSLTNLTEEVSSVSKVKIVAPDGVYISGKWNYLVNTGAIAVHTKDTFNEITINTTRTENIWFSCGPVDVSGKTFQFVVTTDKGDLKREVTFPADRKFESGKIAQFSINMEGVELPTLQSISVSGQKTSFVEGDSFEFGGIVTATYTNGSTKDVTNDCEFSGYDMAVPGEQDVTVTYEGKTTSYKVTVIEVGASESYSLYKGNLIEGDYIIVYSGGAMKAEVNSSRLAYTEVTVSDNVIRNPDVNLIWHIAKNGDYWTIYNEGVAMYAAGTGVKNKAQLLVSGTDSKSLWSVVEDNGGYTFTNKANSEAEVNSILRRNGTYGFACYAQGTGGPLSLYKKN